MTSENVYPAQKILFLTIVISILISTALACPLESGHYVKIKIVTEQCPHLEEFSNDNFDSCTYDKPIENATITFTRVAVPDDMLWMYSFFGMQISEMKDELTTSKITDKNGEAILSLYSSERYNMSITNTSRKDVSLLIIPTESNYVVWVKP